MASQQSAEQQRPSVRNVAKPSGPPSDTPRRQRPGTPISAQLQKKNKPGPPRPKQQRAKAETIPGYERAWHWLNSVPVFKNPGKLEELNKEKDAMELREVFDGLHLEFHRQVNSRFRVGHAISVGSTTETPHYSFSTDYVYGPYYMFGRWLPRSGSVQARFGGSWKFPGKRAFSLRGSGRASSVPNQSSAQIEADLKLPDASASISWHYPKTVEVTYAQALTQRLSAGVLGYYDGTNTGKSGLSFAVRREFPVTFTRENPVTVSAVYSPGFQMSLCLSQSTQKGRKRWTTEMSLLNPSAMSGAPNSNWETLYVVGYHYTLVYSQVKARIDSNLRAGVYMEEKMNPIANFTMCADLDYGKDVYKFGLGLNLRM
eukprot:TRINITY_DN908_c0_g1_i1.p1 TRINITY_DN908_c0_g1~~TRINITY_DN908_c0_g1_i1.p1  ORF type:complete len:418 (+),score=44.03 TRINITY_DN908_c0_g1_i1:140-1255(+)